MALTQLKTAAIADDAVTGAKIADDTVAEANIANDAIGLTELKSGTDGQIITYDASGNPTAVGPGTDGQVLTSTGAGSPPAFEAIPAGVGGATGVDFNDTVKVRLGTGNDLELHHTSNDNIINAQNGNLYIQRAGTTSLIFDGNGDLNLPDNKVLGIGGSADLQLSHNGTDSIIDNNNGELKIQSDNMQFLTSDASEKFIDCNGNGNVEAYHDNSKKFETTSYGTKVTGYQSASSYIGFHVKGTNNDNGFGTNHGSGITSFDIDYYSPIPMFNTKTVQSGSSYLTFPSYGGGNYIKFTAPVAGLYMLELMASVEHHDSNDWTAIGWEVNTTTADGTSEFANNGLGTSMVYTRGGGDEGAGSHFSTTIWLDTNDYAVLYQQSVAAIRWRGNTYYVRGHLI